MSLASRARSIVRRHPRRFAALVAAMLIVGLPIAWYLGSPIFIRTSLVEPAPSGVPTPAATPAPTLPAAGESASPNPATDPPAVAPSPTARTGLELRGEFYGTDDFHFGRGTARLIETAPGTFVVRFEGFSVRNGPDLYVYLSPSPDGYVDGAIEVARLKATDGNFNTPVPPGTDVSGVRSVLIWCKQFSHLFAVAPLS